MDGAARRAAELAARPRQLTTEPREARTTPWRSSSTPTRKVIVQGMTGSEGMKHTQRMLASGTDIVGGVNPRKAGTTVDFEGGVSVPVFGTVKPRPSRPPAPTCRVIFVPASFTKAAVVEAIDAEIPLAVVITEGVPVKDTAEFYNYAKDKGTTRIIGPNCPGLISPGRRNAGIIPADISGTGRIGLVSKSGTLTYQMMYELRDFGFSLGRRHRRRPDHRHDAHRLPRGVPERPRHRRDRHDRRDRRRRRGARGGLHQGARDEAGRRLRRRLHRPRGQDDGPRRRHRVRLARAPRRPRRRPSRPPASRSARRRPRPPTSCARSCRASRSSLRDKRFERAVTFGWPPAPSSRGVSRRRRSGAAARLPLGSRPGVGARSEARIL